MTIEVNSDTIEFKRQGYTILDLFSDIGGIQSLLYQALAFLVSVWNYNMFDNYMVSKLYKLERREQSSRGLKDTFKESGFMKPRRFYNPKEYFRNLLPSWICFCQGCKADRHEKGFELARERMANETNIIEIIKSRRYFNAALRFLLSKKQRMRLKERGRYTLINPDNKTEITREGEESNEYTDGFFSSDSDNFAPSEANLRQQVPRLVQDNETTLRVNSTLFESSNEGLMNPEKRARLTLAKAQKKNLRTSILLSNTDTS